MMRIVLKGTPKSLNEYVGKNGGNAYRHDKAMWTKLVYYAAKATKEIPPEPYEMADVEIMYYFQTRGRHDADNYAGKFLLDGLTRAGVIVDDDLAHIRTHIAGSYDRREPRTIITVKEI